MPTLEERAEFEAHITGALHRLTDHFGLAYVPNPLIRWDLKGQSAIGQAMGVEWIRLHPEAADIIGERYVATAVHEACHTAVAATILERRIRDRSGRWSAHGAEWQRAMRVLGFPPDRLATEIRREQLTPARQVEKFPVTCGCKVHLVTKAVKMNIEQGRREYFCKRCKNAVRVAGGVVL